MRYDITVSNDTLAKCQNKDNVQLYIYMSVRGRQRDAVWLLLTRPKRDVFAFDYGKRYRPKLASVILSGMSSQPALKIALATIWR